MSYVAFITNRFDEMRSFYGERLSFPLVKQWHRPGAQAATFDGGGIRIEVINNAVKASPLSIGEGDLRVQLVIEVTNLTITAETLNFPLAELSQTSWGAFLYSLTDPDGTPVVFLEWRPNRQ